MRVCVCVCVCMKVCFIPHHSLSCRVCSAKNDEDYRYSERRTHTNSIPSGINLAHARRPTYLSPKDRDKKEKMIFKDETKKFFFFFWLRLRLN